jgi:hypothetical protein
MEVAAWTRRRRKGDTNNWWIGDSKNAYVRHFGFLYTFA